LFEERFHAAAAVASFGRSNNKLWRQQCNSCIKSCHNQPSQCNCLTGHRHV